MSRVAAWFKGSFLHKFWAKSMIKAAVNPKP